MIGPVDMRRRWWKNRCACVEQGYLADSVVGVDSSLSPLLQEKTALLAADVSFRKTQEHLKALLGVSLASETIREYCERNAAKIATWQATETDSADTFAKAEGNWELAVDAGKVNTKEKGWRDLKIAVVQKRPQGEAASPDQWQSRPLPEASARLMWADISPSQRFRRNWKSRLKRLGLPSTSALHVLGDGASWIWNSADAALPGCHQTLDIYHATEHIAAAGKRLYGDDSPEAAAFFERGRKLLLEKGWEGICTLIGEEYLSEDTPTRRVIFEKLTLYFAKHLTRLNYAENLRSGKAIGSGVVEGAAKTLGLRLKARGAKWKHRNVRAMAALVCLRNGEEWSKIWRKAA